ncbi:MAG TPA: hypothetical protein PKA51_12160, partial [Kiritimatiellia bacterium]|nr:hypothetical protein [Kiritimatiellia bacterium]
MTAATTVISAWVACAKVEGPGGSSGRTLKAEAGAPPPNHAFFPPCRYARLLLCSCLSMTDHSM